MYDEEDNPQIECSIMRNDGKIYLVLSYGTVKIAGEDDDI